MIPNIDDESSDYITIGCGLVEHPLVQQLIRDAGSEGFVGLVSLWCWAAQNAPTGDLCDLDSATLEAVAGWTGEPGQLLAALIDLGWIESRPHGYVLIDSSVVAGEALTLGTPMQFGGVR